MKTRHFVLALLCVSLAPLSARAQPTSRVVRTVMEELTAGGRAGEEAAELSARLGCTAVRTSELARLGESVEQVGLLARTGEAARASELLSRSTADLTAAVESSAAAAATGRQLGKTGLLAISGEEAATLAKQGYFSRQGLFTEDFADRFAKEIDRLIDEGLLVNPADRMVDGQPTEWIANIGQIYGKQSDALLEESPLLRDLYDDLVEFANSYNAARARMIETGEVTAEEVPALAAEGAEMNVNLVVGSPAAQYSGLHLHQDMNRFTAALEAIRDSSVYHTAVRGRAFTFAGYARPIGENGERMNDIGGALPFILRRGMRAEGERAIFDIHEAHHNTGAFFYPHTLHGVARMPPAPQGSYRYSFQVFYPEQRVWTEEVAPRIESGELAEEVERFLQTGER